MPSTSAASRPVPPRQKGTFGNLSDDGVILSRAKIEADATQLWKSANVIEEFADRVVAHLDPRGADEAFSYGDLALATAEFDRIACRYIVLLTGDGYESLRPVIQFNWERVFDFPLRMRPRKRTAGARRRGTA